MHGFCDAPAGRTGLWRDARTHTPHDPKWREYCVIGDWALNGGPPLRHEAI